MPKKKQKNEPYVPLIPAAPEIRYLPLDLHGRDCTMTRGYALAMFVEHEMTLEQVAEACGLSLEIIATWARRYKWEETRSVCFQLISRRLLDQCIQRKLDRVTTEAIGIMNTAKKMLRSIDLRLDDILSGRSGSGTVGELMQLANLLGQVCRDTDPMIHRLYLATGSRFDAERDEKKRPPDTPVAGGVSGDLESCRGAGWCDSGAPRLPRG